MLKKLVFLASLFLIFSHSLFAQNQVDLVQDAQKTGISFYWDPMTYTGLLEKNGHRISFRAGDDYCLQDYKKIIPEKAPVMQDGKLVANKTFMNTAENFFKAENVEVPYRIGAVLIDAGHGGKDPGASRVHRINGKNVNVVEKDINLKVAKMLCENLKSAYPDKKILMTRSTDVYLTLQQRTEIANSVKLKNNEAILFISIHVNTNFDQKVSGYEVWYLTPGYRRQVLDAKQYKEDAAVLPILNSMMEEEYTTESILIAKFITEGIAAQVGNLSPQRKIKPEEWFVCKNSKMPSVLCEIGFLSNPTEAALLADDKYLQKISLGIYNGLRSFVTHFERSRGFTGK